MKTNKLIIGLLAVAAISLVSCEKFGADVETPSVCISVSPENPKVGEEVTVTINTDAQYLTLFTGDEGKNFERSRIKAIMEHDMKNVIGSLMRRMGRRPWFINNLRTIRV